MKPAIILAALLLAGCAEPVEDRHVDLDRMEQVWGRMEEKTAASHCTTEWPAGYEPPLDPSPELPPGEHSIVVKRSK